jgi:hypothetical protein
MLYEIKFENSIFSIALAHNHATFGQDKLV